MAFPHSAVIVPKGNIQHPMHTVLYPPVTAYHVRQLLCLAGQGVIAWAKQLGSGCLMVDHVVVSKPFCRRSPWAGWTYSTSEKRTLRGFHVVVLLWCSGCWRIPVAFRLWHPKKSCRPMRYRKKSQLA
jgi:hypothetical protein